MKPCQHRGNHVCVGVVMVSEASNVCVGCAVGKGMIYCATIVEMM